MAIKNTVFLVIFIVSFSIYSYEQALISPVKDIWLVEIGEDKIFTPPDRLVIGIDLTENAYYKLSDKENVIKGGLFKKGPNFIDIEANDLFKKSGTHVYSLDLKVGEFVLREKIEIDIQLDFDDVDVQSKNKAENPEYELSMFIGDRLVLSSKKFLPKNLSFEIEKPPLPENYGPFYEVRGRDKNPMLNSFSIIDAVGAAYGLIKKMIDKKRMRKTEQPLKKYRQQTVAFIRRDSEGISREIHALITLKSVKDIL
jgi:hypothetical protein